MKFTNYLLVSVLIVTAFSECSNKTSADPQPLPPDSPDTLSTKIISWVTKPDESALLSRQPALPYSNSNNGHPFIDVDASQTYQSIDGFGYTLTGGSADLIFNMSSDARSKLLTELFGNEESSISVSYLRISIGASDLNATVFTYDDMPAGQTDPMLANFSLDPDRNALIPLLKQIIAIRPDIKILATPWTPPVWMKDTLSSIGGNLKPEYYGAYANYFVKYIQEMKAEGITIDAITPQNEPLHPENNPSLHMFAEEQAEFIKTNLGPAFIKANLSTRIIIYDHNCDRPDYPLTILNDPAAKAFIDGSAFHLYAGDISALSQVRNAHPAKNIYFTEQFTSIDGSFGGDLQWHLKNLVIGAPRNWSRTVLEWNLANDVNYGPHTPGGCTTCKGALTISGSAVKRNVAYYIIAHASKFVPTGSVRISSNISGNLHNVAYTTPNGQNILIVLNDAGTAATFNIRFNNKWGTVNLPAGAVATYVL